MMSPNNTSKKRNTAHGKDHVTALYVFFIEGFNLYCWKGNSFFLIFILCFFYLMFTFHLLTRDLLRELYYGKTLPILSGALLLVLADLHYNLLFFDPIFGGDPIFYQHLFWFFGL